MVRRGRSYSSHRCHQINMGFICKQSHFSHYLQCESQVWRMGFITDLLMEVCGSRITNGTLQVSFWSKEKEITLSCFARLFYFMEDTPSQHMFRKTDICDETTLHFLNLHLHLQFSMITMYYCCWWCKLRWLRCYSLSEQMCIELKYTRQIFLDC